MTLTSSCREDTRKTHPAAPLGSQRQQRERGPLGHAFASPCNHVAQRQQRERGQQCCFHAERQSGGSVVGMLAPFSMSSCQIC